MSKLKEFFKKSVDNPLSDFEKKLYNLILTILQNPTTKIHTSLKFDKYFIENTDINIEFFYETNYIVMTSKEGYMQLNISDKLNNMIMKEYRRLSNQIDSSFNSKINSVKNSYIDNLKECFNNNEK